MNSSQKWWLSIKRFTFRNYLTWAIYLLVGLLSYVGIAFSGELLPLTDFYDTPESFTTTGKPGDLIHSERYDGYKLAQGVKATRILYGTTNSRGDLVTSSGVVLVPRGKAPEGGWPVIAWAHGTSGVNRRCAPSLMAENYSDSKAPNIYTEMGYAVVATDYAGLGTDYPLDYLDRISNGWDVINSVKAARAALPELGQKWLAIGHSAGAHAVRGVAELQADINDPSYLGIVSVSGLGDARTPMAVLSKFAPSLVIYISESVKARYSDFNQADIFKEKGQELLEKVKTNCSGPGTPRPKEPQPKGSEVLAQNWESNPYIDKYFKLDETNLEKYQDPVLVINGKKEIPPILANDIEAVKRMCQRGVKVQLELIPDANHISVLSASIKEQMDWAADRFAGREAPSNCNTILK